MGGSFCLIVNSHFIPFLFIRALNAAYLLFVEGCFSFLCPFLFFFLPINILPQLTLIRNGTHIHPFVHPRTRQCNSATPLTHSAASYKFTPSQSRIETASLSTSGKVFGTTTFTVITTPKRCRIDGQARSVCLCVLPSRLCLHGHHVTSRSSWHWYVNKNTTVSLL